jgi:hypothetical protein
MASDKEYELQRTDRRKVDKFEAKDRHAAIERVMGYLGIAGEEMSVEEFKRKGGRALMQGQRQIFP